MQAPNGANLATDVGIDAIEFYFPINYVDQQDLETYNNVSSGKYTIGLGQKQMGFCADNEDIVSISMTVTKKLLDTYEIDKNSIGCLVVGTETLIDKSKSVKTCLMDLFDGNTDIEGVDIKNACFGGAQALLHAVDWVHVNHPYSKKNAIVIIADIAVYENGPARCTGGAGAMAFLITPNSTIPIDRVFASCHMRNTWDFYKPICEPISEFPVVDGTLSLASYLGAVKSTYTNFKKKVANILDKEVSLNDFDGIFLHSPFTKMVQKGLAVMNYCDSTDNQKELDVNSREEMTRIVGLSSDMWKQKTDKYLIFNRRIGNMYTPSLFAQLLAYIGIEDWSSPENQRDRNVLLFAYGSGLASAVFPARICRTDNLEKIRQVALSAIERLDSRKKYSAEEFTSILELRAKALVEKAPYEPKADSMSLKMFDKTFFLKNVDSLYRRQYCLYEQAQTSMNGNGYH